MRVAIAGGHGQIALLLTRLLSARGDEVRSLIRNPGHAEDIRAMGGEPVVCDLETAAMRAAGHVIEGVDAVVYAAGSGAGSGPDRKWTVDYAGALKLIGACELSGIRRYVMVSSIMAGSAREGADDFSVYLRAKGRADAELIAAGLDWTIVRPAYLSDDPGTGLVHIAERVGDSARVPRADVAAVLASVLATPQTVHRTFELAAGDVPVEQAVAAVARLPAGA